LPIGIETVYKAVGIDAADEVKMGKGKGKAAKLVAEGWQHQPEAALARRVR